MKHMEAPSNEEVLRFLDELLNLAIKNKDCQTLIGCVQLQKLKIAFEQLIKTVEKEEKGE